MMKKMIYTALFIMLTAFLLIYPSQCLTFALNGLNLWFQKMVPALLPFMILSGMMIRMNLTDKIVYLLRPILQPVYQIHSDALYVIVVGFLCGFPMGARVCADLYERGRITRTEASFLLSFCNNIGPIYFTGFVMTTLSLEKTVPYLFGMYGLPLIYGLIMRYTVYRNMGKTAPLKSDHMLHPLSLPEALDESITAGIESITKLGGYMIFFNLLNIVPMVFLDYGKIYLDKFHQGEFHLNNLLGLCSCLLEITGGIQAMGNRNPFAVLVLLPLGGLSCLAQTYGMISHTDLSIGNYVIHKIILTIVSFGYYAIILL